MWDGSKLWWWWTVQENCYILSTLRTKYWNIFSTTTTIITWAAMAAPQLHLKSILCWLLSSILTKQVGREVEVKLANMTFHIPRRQRWTWPAKYEVHVSTHQWVHWAVHLPWLVIMVSTWVKIVTTTLMWELPGLQREDRGKFRMKAVCLRTLPGFRVWMDCGFYPFIKLVKTNKSKLCP